MGKREFYFKNRPQQPFTISSGGADGLSESPSEGQAARWPRFAKHAPTFWTLNGLCAKPIT